jgi:Putative transmembrane protein (PGPGW)
MQWWIWLALTTLGILLGLIIVYVFFRDFYILVSKNRMFRRILGISLVTLGIIGIFLPVLQGWLMIFIGLSILKIPFLENLVRRIAAKVGVRFSKKTIKKGRQNL